MTREERLLNESWRFWTKVEITADCWLWRSTINKRGYGLFWSTEERRNVPAHKWAYRAMVGEVPEGLQLDHLCRVTACVRSEHLEPVTGRVNVLRGFNPCSLNARKTHCKRGHPYTPDNLQHLKKRERRCRICHAAYTREWRKAAKQRALTPPAPEEGR